MSSIIKTVFIICLSILPIFSFADLSIKKLNKIHSKCNPNNQHGGLGMSETDKCMEAELIKPLRKYSGKDSYKESICFISAEFYIDIIVYKEKGYSIEEAMKSHDAKRANLSKFFISGVRKQYETAYRNTKPSQQAFNDLYEGCLNHSL